MRTLSRLPQKLIRDPSCSLARQGNRVMPLTLSFCCSLRRRARLSGRLASLALARGASMAQGCSFLMDPCRPSVRLATLAKARGAVGGPGVLFFDGSVPGARPLGYARISSRGRGWPKSHDRLCVLQCNSPFTRSPWLSRPLVGIAVHALGGIRAACGTGPRRSRAQPFR